MFEIVSKKLGLKEPKTLRLTLNGIDIRYDTKKTLSDCKIQN